MERGLRSIVIGFALVVIGFVGATVYVQRSARALDVSAMSIATKAMPSIEHLTAARAEIRTIGAMARELVGRSDEEGRANLEAARSRLDGAVEAYLALPFYEREQDQWRALRRDLAELDRRVEDVLTLSRHANSTALRSLVDGPLRHSLDVAADQLRELVEFNAAQGRALSLKIERMRRRADTTALLLDIACAILTIFVAVRAARAVRQYQRVLEERRELQTRRADELEQFASRVAHDILGPLSAVRMALDLGKKRADASLKTAFERGDRAVHHVAVIVDGLLRFARAGASPEPGVRTPVAPVLEELIGGLIPEAEAKNIRLSVAEVPEVAVGCNPGVLSSLVENLLRNAIKFIDGGGGRNVDVRVIERGARVRFEVEDTGPGIPAELQRSIFEPYVRGRRGEGGIGLGLATVKRIVDAHRGRLGIESIVGKGSMFWFELPKVELTPELRPEPAPQLH